MTLLMDAHRASDGLSFRRVGSIAAVAFLGFSPIVAVAGPLNTQIDPFTHPGVTTLVTDLEPQSAPVASVASGANTMFGVNGLDPNSLMTNSGVLSATISSSSEPFPGASGSAFAQSNSGVLSVRNNMAGAPPFGGSVDAHSSAAFRDALTITSSSLPLGSLAFLTLLVTVDGTMSCDGVQPTCPIGLAFGYAPDTLGRADFIHQIGGESPEPGEFETTQELVPLPFLSTLPWGRLRVLLRSTRTVPRARTSQVRFASRECLFETPRGIWWRMRRSQVALGFPMS